MKKLNLIFLTIIAIIIISGTTVLLLNLSLIESPQILNVKIEDSEWLKFTNTKMVKSGNADYVFPSDSFQLQSDLQNKMHFSLEIIPTVIIKHNTQETIFESNSIVLNPTTSQELILNFKPNFEGKNEIILSFTLFNHTNNQLIDKNEFKLFEVFVQPYQNELQYSMNRQTLLSIIISAIVSSTTLLFLAYQTSKWREDKNQTIRAWISKSGSNSISIFKILGKNDKSKSLEEWNEMKKEEKLEFLDHYEIAIRIKNFGQTPAFNVRARYAIHYEQNEDSSKLKKLGSSSELMPNDETMYSFELKKESVIHKEDKNGYNFYITVKIFYDTAGKSDVYGFVFGYRENKFTTIKSLYKE